jgi:hypothetical protein
VAEAVFPPGGTVTSTAGDLAARLAGRTPPFFDPDGNRRGGSGEYILLLRPRRAEGDRAAAPPAFAAFTRTAPDADWTLVGRLALPAGPAPVRLPE